MDAPPLLAYYGDDFTGSTDVMEALELHGVPTVLFLEAPQARDLRRFAHCRAIGVAGMSRSESPAWMDEHLPGIFAALGAIGAPICHYKVCSTFDSSPHVGSIGRAIEIGRQALGSDVVPLVVGAPALRRYVVFGNLFASVDGEAMRIDRHPTMSCHPVTPMRESDLRRHLQEQTDLPIGLVDVLALQAGRAGERFAELRAAGCQVVLFDTLDESNLAPIGKAIWEERAQPRCFVAGSSGVEYALLAWWGKLGWLPPQVPLKEVGPVDRLLVVSGSCSPVTGRQIEYALAEGFRGIPLDPVALVSEESTLHNAMRRAEEVLRAGESPVLFTASGPGDIAAEASGGGDFGRQIGMRLGQLAAELQLRCGVRRVLSAGGDTSGFVGKALEIQALTMLRPFAPGSPLCRVWSRNPARDGVEVLLKGGQVGRTELFVDVRRGSLR